MQMNGKVKWFNERKGYGFIEGEDGNDYFVHSDTVKGGDLYDGDAVTFDPAEGDRGKKAENVTKA
jgi:CspA family cold shock protein